MVRDLEGARLIEWCNDPGDAPVDRPSLAEAPDPHFAGGWRAALRSALADPEWPVNQAMNASMFEDQRSQLEFMLDNLPDPPSAPDRSNPTTSVTGLVTLATCPQRFYWSEIDRLPRRPAPWLRRGTELHRRIELHHRGVSALDLPDGAVSPDEGAPGRGIDAFAAFLGSRFASMRPILVESPLDMSLAGTQIRGRIDAVFGPEPGTLEIVDYKSGSRRDDPAALVQLQAYAVAASAGAVAQRRPDALRVTFVYFGTDPPEEVSVDVTDGWLAESRERVATLAAAVSGDVYPATPSDACRHCDFTAFCEVGRRWLGEHGSTANGR